MMKPENDEWGVMNDEWRVMNDERILKMVNGK